VATLRESLPMQAPIPLSQLREWLDSLVNEKGFDPERATAKVGKTTGPVRAVVVREER
jgi:hypothetical protein